MSEIIVDTNKLNDYAKRVSRVTTRVIQLDSRVDDLYYQTKNKDLKNIKRTDALIYYNQRLKLCRSYLIATATDFENAENFIRKTDPDSFGNSGNVINDVLSFFFRELTFRIPGGINSLRDVFDVFDTVYNEFPRELKLAFEVFVPDAVIDAYTVVSGLVQGDLTAENLWDAAKNLAVGKKSGKISIVLESIEYSFKKGLDRSNEMDRQMLEQLKEGDVLGLTFDLAEGFVDTIIGGVIDVSGNVAGDLVDNLIDNFPIVKGFNMLSEYGTGLIGLNKGDGYSVGGLISAGAEALSDGVDYVTDGITYVTDFVTDGITEGFKGGIKLVKSGLTNLLT